MNEPDAIEVRMRTERTVNWNREIAELWLSEPLARIVSDLIPQGMGVRVNGQWYVKADEFESDYLEKEWMARA